MIDIIHIGAVQIVVLQLQDQNGREQTAAGHRRVGRGNGVEPSEPMGQALSLIHILPKMIPKTSANRSPVSATFKVIIKPGMYFSGNT